MSFPDFTEVWAPVQPWCLAVGEDLVFAGDGLEVWDMDDERAAELEVDWLLAQFDRELAAKRRADEQHRRRRRVEGAVLRRFPRRPVAEWLGDDEGSGSASGVAA